MIEQVVRINWEEIISSLPSLETLDEQELERLMQVRRDYDMLRERFALLYYEPQELPHQQGLFYRSAKKIKAAFGGNQSGKTTALLAGAFQVALGINPYVKTKIPNRGRIGTTDLGKGIGEDIEGLHMARWIPDSEVMYRKRYSSGQISKIGFKNKSTIDFLSYEQEDKIWEGWQGDWVALNEPPPREKYIACLRGLVKTNGQISMAATLLTEPWIYDEIYLKAGSVDIDVFNFDIYDNKYLSAESIKIFADSLDPDEKQIRLHGIPRALTGLVYKNFNVGLHCDFDEFEVPGSWTVYSAMDYHPASDIRMVWIAASPDSHLWVFDELICGGTIKEISEKIKAKENGRKVYFRFIDPLSATPERSGNKVTCAMREFGRYGLYMRPWNKDFTVGLNSVREALRPDREGKAIIHFIKNQVPETIKAMTHYQWDNPVKLLKIGDGKTVEEYKHLPDCLRGILIFNPHYVELKPDKKEKYEYESNPITGYGH